VITRTIQNAFGAVCPVLLILTCGCVYASGRDNAVIENAGHFDWLTDAPFAPTFAVLDTESSLGPYASSTKTITLKDLVNMHGHPCDGLAASPTTHPASGT